MSYGAPSDEVVADDEQREIEAVYKHLESIGTEEVEQLRSKLVGVFEAYFSNQVLLKDLLFPRIMSDLQGGKIAALQTAVNFYEEYNDFRNEEGLYLGTASANLQCFDPLTSLNGLLERAEALDLNISHYRDLIDNLLYGKLKALSEHLSDSFFHNRTGINVDHMEPSLKRLLDAHKAINFLRSSERRLEMTAAFQKSYGYLLIYLIRGSDIEDGPKPLSGCKDFSEEEFRQELEKRKSYALEWTPEIDRPAIESALSEELERLIQDHANGSLLDLIPIRV